MKPKFILVHLSHFPSHATYLEYNKIHTILIIKKNGVYVLGLFNYYPNLFDKDR